MQGQRGQDFETAARGRHSFRFLRPRPNDRLPHALKEATDRGTIYLDSQCLFQGLAHFLEAQVWTVLVHAAQEPFCRGAEFAVIALAAPVEETSEPLPCHASLVAKILSPTKGYGVFSEVLVHRQTGSRDFFYHRCDLLDLGFPAGRGSFHPTQHRTNGTIWPARSAVFPQGEGSAGAELC